MISIQYIIHNIGLCDSTDKLRRVEEQCRSAKLFEDPLNRYLIQANYQQVNSGNFCSILPLQQLTYNTLLTESRNQDRKPILVVRHPMLLLIDLFTNEQDFERWIHLIIMQGVTFNGISAEVGYQQIQACYPCSGKFSEVVMIEQFAETEHFNEYNERAKRLYGTLDRTTRAKLVAMVAREMALFGYTWDLDTSSAGCKINKDKLGRACC